MENKINLSVFVKSEIFSGLLMIVSFVLALLVSNIDSLSELYIKFIFCPIFFGTGKFFYETTLINLVNDGLMTLFFLLISLELKYHFVLGELQERKALILPTAAALGGIIAPALIYTFFNSNNAEDLKGWAIPIATDTAFMLGILSFFGTHISSKLRAFIIGFSLIDDALALMILAIFYTNSLNIPACAISLALLTILITLNVMKIKNSSIYLFIGIFLWIAMVEAGIHGTLCGAVLALIIPIKIDKKVNISFHNLENSLRPLVHYLILPFFIFINSGIRFDHFSTEILMSNISIGIIFGLFLGKQLGIAGFSYITIKKGWCTLPPSVSFTKFYSICILGGIGFTLSLFIGDLTFETGEPHYAMRNAVIIGSLLSALFGILLLAYSTKSKD